MGLIYLDLCCFNRPFDDQTPVIIRQETDAKLEIQFLIKENRHALIWSYILEYENSANPDPYIANAVSRWRDLALITVTESATLLGTAEYFHAKGIGVKDSLHLASAISARADYFLTVDQGILKRRGLIQDPKVLNPVEFLFKEVRHENR